MSHRRHPDPAAHHAPVERLGEGHSRCHAQGYDVRCADAAGNAGRLGGVELRRVVGDEPRRRPQAYDDASRILLVAGDAYTRQIELGGDPRFRPGQLPAVEGVADLEAQLLLDHRARHAPVAFENDLADVDLRALGDVDAYLE